MSMYRHTIHGSDGFERLVNQLVDHVACRSLTVMYGIALHLTRVVSHSRNIDSQCCQLMWYGNDFSSTDHYHIFEYVVRGATCKQMTR